MIGRCPACPGKDRLIDLLTKQVEERDRTLLAILDPAVYRARYPAPPPPKVEPSGEPTPMPLTRDQLRNTSYTLPGGETAHEQARRIEQEFELADIYGPENGNGGTP